MGLSDLRIIDTQSIYQQLLEMHDDAERAALFERELVAPFAGLTRMFGADSVQVFAQWGISAAQFSASAREETRRKLRLMADHKAWEQATEALHEASAALEKHMALERVGTVVFALMLYESAYSFGDGYAGFGAIPGWVMTTYNDPTPANMRKVKAATAHELHHQVCSWLLDDDNKIMTNLGTYMIGEGLAESFAAELYGEEAVGMWVTSFDMSRLAETKQRFRDNLTLTGFDTLRQYIFGDLMTEYAGVPQTGIPAYAGYALGYHTVQAYLRRTGKSVAEATLVPAHQIIAESGYLDE